MTAVQRTVHLGVARSGTPVRMAAVVLPALLVASEAVFSRLDDRQFAGHWQTAVRLGACGACGLFGLVNLHKAVQRLLSSTGLVVAAFGCWAVLTVPFAVEPVYSCGTAMALWCVILFAASLNDETEYRWVLGSVLLSLLGLLVASWVVHFAYPAFEQQVLDQDQLDRLAGVAFHPNHLGTLSVTLIALLLAVGMQGWARWGKLVIPLAFAATTVVMTGSRTSMVAAAAVSVAAGIMLIRSAKPNIAFAVFAAVLAAVILAGSLTGVTELTAQKAATTLSRTGDPSEVYSMTGRTELWSFPIHKIFESPWVGYGYGCSRFIMMTSYYETIHAHNQLLNVALEMGLVGAGLFLLQVGVFALRFFGTRDPVSTLIFVVVLVNGLTEQILLAPTPDSLTLLWFLALLAPTAKSNPLGGGSMVISRYAHASARASQDPLHPRCLV
jgi:O-antigen ligase